jgi:uncharacterized membrane protein (DUF373 family)
MNTFREIREHYNFTPKDEERLTSLSTLMKDYAEECVRRLHEKIYEMKDALLIEKLDTRKNLSQHQKSWFLALFSGDYDSHYYHRLIKIGRVHMKEGIEPHYLSVSMNTLRAFLMEVLSERIEDRELRTELKESLNKIIDINLDIITNAYVEEEIMQYATAYKVKTALVTFAERFSTSMNLILILSLIVITIGIVGMFVSDLLSLFRGDIAHGIITALGTLLILWVMIELMNTEISHLKGGKLYISVFVGVALVAVIREIMIATLQHEKMETMYYLIAATLVIGIVFWLVTKAEEKIRK